MNSIGRQAGFTLVELLIGLAIATLLMGLGLPTFADQWRMARRSDAITSLTRLQMAQEQYRAHHGVYAAALAALAVPARSEAGYYDLVLQTQQAQAYQATAQARGDGSQSADLPCLSIVLSVNDGMAQTGPDARCWNR